MKNSAKLLLIALSLALFSQTAMTAPPPSSKNRLWAKTNYLESADQGLYEMQYNPNLDKLFVAVIDKVNRERNYGAINVYDSKTLQQLDSYPMPYRAFSLEQDINNNLLYVGHTQSLLISKVDAKTGKVLLTSKKLALDPQTKHENLRHMTYVESTKELFVTYINLTKDYATEVKLLILDADSLELKGEVTDAYPKRGFGLTMDKSTGKLYTSGTFINEIDPATRKVVKKFDLTAGPVAVTGISALNIDKANNRIFATNFATEGEGYAISENDGLFVFDLTNGKQLAFVKTGNGAQAVQYNPKYNEIYVTNFRSATLSVVDATDYKIKATITVHVFPNMMTQSSDHSRLFVGVKEGFSKKWNPEEFVEGAKERIMSFSLDSDPLATTSK